MTPKTKQVVKSTSVILLVCWEERSYSFGAVSKRRFFAGLLSECRKSVDPKGPRARTVSR